MAVIFKILATIGAIVASVFVTVESVRGGLLVASALFVTIKVIVILLFLALLAIILYLLLKQPKATVVNKSARY